MEGNDRDPALGKPQARSRRARKARVRCSPRPRSARPPECSVLHSHYRFSCKQIRIDPRSYISRVRAPATKIDKPPFGRPFRFWVRVSATRRHQRPQSTPPGGWLEAAIDCPLGATRRARGGRWNGGRARTRLRPRSVGASWSPGEHDCGHSQSEAERRDHEGSLKIMAWLRTAIMA